MTPPDHESDLACGILDIGDGNLISFETYGIPVGKPALETLFTDVYATY